jgi:hypothetical protein
MRGSRRGLDGMSVERWSILLSPLARKRWRGTDTSIEWKLGTSLLAAETHLNDLQAGMEASCNSVSKMGMRTNLAARAGIWRPLHFVASHAKDSIGRVASCISGRSKPRFRVGQSL